MNLMANAMSGVEAALLPVAAALLLEELTYRRIGPAAAGSAAETGRTSESPITRRRREMIALKLLLTVAGVLLLACARWEFRCMDSGCASRMHAASPAETKPRRTKRK